MNKEAKHARQRIAMKNRRWREKQGFYGKLNYQNHTKQWVEEEFVEKYICGPQCHVLSSLDPKVVGHNFGKGSTRQL